MEIISYDTSMYALMASLMCNASGRKLFNVTASEGRFVMFDHTIQTLSQISKQEIAQITLKLQGELRDLQARLALARIIIADQQDKIKHKSQALRAVMQKRKSLSQTVKRRRKHSK